MKLSRFFRFSKKEDAKEKNPSQYGSFSDFLLNASDAAQKEAITRAAQRSNEEQREILLRSGASLER